MRTVPLDCPHFAAREVYVCYECAAANLDAFARQQVEIERSRWISDQCTANQAGHAMGRIEGYTEGWNAALEQARQQVEAFREQIIGAIPVPPTDDDEGIQAYHYWVVDAIRALKSTA